MPAAVSSERATEAKLIKFTPSERAAIDRARGEEGFAVFVKRYMAEVCRLYAAREASDEGGDDGGSGS